MLSEMESEPFLKEPDDASSDTFHATSKKATGHLNRFNLRRRKLSTFLSHALAIFLTSAFWVSTLFVAPKLGSISFPWHQVHYNSTLLPGRNYYHCGDDLESAKARGCAYDMLDNHWVPEKCVDQEAIKEYQADGNWFGYTDENHTTLLREEELGETSVYFTNERDHIVHCAMLWRKQFRALIEGRKYLDSLIVDEKHTVHCSKYLIDMSDKGEDFRKNPIEVRVGFAGCHIKE